MPMTTDKTENRPESDSSPASGQKPDAVNKKQALAAHLKALRKVLIVSATAVCVAFLVIFYLLCDPLVDFILAPVRARGIQVVSSAVSDALMMKFKACLVAAAVVAMPVCIGQIWSFVAPALYPREKRTFALLFFLALFLFILGVVFCYLYVFPLTIDLFWQAADGVATTLWSVKEYFSFVLSFVLPFGVMFELPVVVYMLARRGWVTYEWMSKNRKYMILAIFTIAAILTPPDVVSQCMLAAPMLILYEISAQVARVVKKKDAA